MGTTDEAVPATQTGQCLINADINGQSLPVLRVSRSFLVRTCLVCQLRRPSEMLWPASTTVLVSCPMKFLRISLVIQIILAAYFQAVLWLPLGSWNDQPGKRLLTLLSEGQALAVLGFAFAMLLPVLLFALSLWKHRVWLMWVGLIGYGAWATLQFQSWWIPWIFGADQRALNNQKFLRRTYKIFPSSIGHPAPDAMHFVLDLLLFSAVVTIALGLIEIRRRSASANKL